MSEIDTENAVRDVMYSAKHHIHRLTEKFAQRLDVERRRAEEAEAELALLGENPREVAKRYRMHYARANKAEADLAAAQARLAAVTALCEHWERTDGDALITDMAEPLRAALSAASAEPVIDAIGKSITGSAASPAEPDPIRARLNAIDENDCETCSDFVLTAALWAVLDLTDHGGTRPVAEWVSAPVLRAVIADALGVSDER